MATTKAATTMQTREYSLIAGAAGAAGIGWSKWDGARLAAEHMALAADMLWNPMRSMGDAGRLAAQLRISVLYIDDYVQARHPGGFVNIRYADDDGPQACEAATREAITTAAAILYLGSVPPSPMRCV